MKPGSNDYKSNRWQQWSIRANYKSSRTTNIKKFFLSVVHDFANDIVYWLLVTQIFFVFLWLFILYKCFPNVIILSVCKYTRFHSESYKLTVVAHLFTLKQTWNSLKSVIQLWYKISSKLYLVLTQFKSCWACFRKCLKWWNGPCFNFSELGLKCIDI